jgi:hypothetical protein
MSRNHLSEESSPYLRQHMHNPVHWRPWGQEAIDEAAKQRKPILLSIGYAACHWCHVMAHESFESAETASVMNDLFINIKVDREERPDVDAIYQSALSLMGQQGGWPLTMFLTPDGHPFWGGTYFPPTPRWGRPGFADVLRAVSRTFKDEPDKVETNVKAIRHALDHLARPPSGRGFTPQALETAAATGLRLVDLQRGGTSGAPKFPQPSFFRGLWRVYTRGGAPMFRDAVVVTLDNLCHGGIYDHVGGGFARYATDEDWLVPHFEKMLYDNALLVELTCEVWPVVRNPVYARRIRETLTWMLTDLRVDHPNDGTFAFASAFDADSEGVEGKYYVWTAHEIDALLGADASLFKAVYDVSEHGNWEGHTILNRRQAPAPRSDDDEERLAACLLRLRRARAGRVPPQRDNKVLADCNGMAIVALTVAAVVFEELAWLEAAETVFAFVTRSMQEAGRLRHVWCDGRARHPAVIDDYANMARAAISLYEATGQFGYLDAAADWVATADRHYWDGETGGYFLSADDTHDVITRTKSIFDHATPSGNGVMAEVLARLFHLTGDLRFRQRCHDLLTLFSGDNPNYLVSVPGLLAGYQWLEASRQVVIIGDGDQAAALKRAVFTSGQPFRTVMLLPPGTTAPAGHPAHGKAMIDGQATAYVCSGTTCGLPVTDPFALRTSLTAH